MAKPALVAVVGDRDDREELADALRRRFGADYLVVAESAPAAALAVLGRLAEAGGQAALVLADQRLEEMTGVELLRRAHQLHPAAQRVLLCAYGDVATGLAALQAVSLGQLDHWLNTPFGPPELRLYPAVAKLLGRWARATAGAGSFPEPVRLVGPRLSPRTHALRDLLSRNNIPYGFYQTESDDGRRLLASAGLGPVGRPVVLMTDGRVLVDPPNERLAQALGAETRPAAGHYDVAVVGAGPAGLAAAVYASSEGLATL
jgi:thioredoxin reductase (NADPH)